MQQPYMITDIFQFPQVVGCDHRSHVPVFDLCCENALYCLAHYRIQAVKGLITEKIICIGTDAQDHRYLLFHALGKSVDLSLFV